MSKLLFDQNISFRTLRRLPSVFADSGQVKSLGLENQTDLEIWHFAKKNNYTIVTFDADFYDIANIQNCPPKIIWLRCRNQTTNYILQLLTKHQDVITDFIHKSEYKDILCLEIG